MHFRNTKLFIIKLRMNIGKIKALNRRTIESIISYKLSTFFIFLHQLIESSPPYLKNRRGPHFKGILNNNHENKLFISNQPQQQKKSFSPLEEQSTSICAVILIQNCWERCSLLHPRHVRNADGWFFVFFKYVLFFQYNVQTLGNKC